MSTQTAKVTCDGCGACCRHMRSPPHLVFFVDGEWRPIDGAEEDFALLMAAPEEARRLKAQRLFEPLDVTPEEAPCVWLDEGGRCRFYAHRPTVCRDFELGSEDCLRVRRLYQIQ